MIFVSLGTMDMPFERMAQAVDRFAATCEEEVIVQTGWTDYNYKHVAKAFKMCTKDEMAQYQKEASILIMQGGWGSICESMEMGKRMVIIPRYDVTEHIHDQFQLIRKLDEIEVVLNVDPLSSPCLGGGQEVMDFSDKKVFEENKQVLFDATFEALVKAVEKARTFEFKKIEGGETESRIREKIAELNCGKKICLASSAGGHLRELQLAIGSIPFDFNCYWLTLKTTSTKAFMADKEHVFLQNFQPARKWTFFVNAIQALWWVAVKRPTCIITTGAGVCVPTIAFAKKLLGTKVVFINSAADVTHASKTPVWIKKYADLFLVQWEEMKEIFPDAVCCGVLV